MPPWRNTESSCFSAAVLFACCVHRGKHKALHWLPLPVLSIQVPRYVRVSLRLQDLRFSVFILVLPVLCSNTWNGQFLCLVFSVKNKYPALLQNVNVNTDLRHTLKGYVQRKGLKMEGTMKSLQLLFFRWSLLLTDLVDVGRLFSLSTVYSSLLTIILPSLLIILLLVLLFTFLMMILYLQNRTHPNGKIRVLEKSVPGQIKRSVGKVYHTNLSHESWTSKNSDTDYDGCEAGHGSRRLG